MSGTLVKLALFTVLVVGVVGCGPSGPPMGKVRGTVTYQGKPLSTGTITFISQEEGIPSPMGEIQADGTYEITTPTLGKGAPLGHYGVIIVAFRDMGTDAPVVELLPSKYGSDQQSGLTADVTEGENTIDFELK